MDKLRAGAAKLGLSLSSEQLAQFQTYYYELLDWNRRINLTAITDYESVQVKHFLDSLTVTQVLEKPPPEAGFSAIDVGSGAGFPGVPLKIAFPAIRLVLLEATGKKAAFLRHLVAQLGLEQVEVVPGRAEEVAHEEKYREKYSLVLSRAVARLAVLAELALPFAALGGCFIAQKKGEVKAEVKQAGAAIVLLGGKVRDVRQVELEELADRRYLAVIDKVAPSPEKYPRRPGVPAKKPLSA